MLKISIIFILLIIQLQTSSLFIMETNEQKYICQECKSILLQNKNCTTCHAGSACISPTHESNEPTRLEIALHWWNNLPSLTKERMFDTYMHDEKWLSVDTLTVEDIERVFKRHTQALTLEQFKSQIPTFSKEDKIEALRLLYTELQEFKKYDKVKVAPSKNASDFSMLTGDIRGVYAIPGYANTVFEIAGDPVPVFFKHNPFIWCAYPLRLDGKTVGFVYNTGLKLAE